MIMFNKYDNDNNTDIKEDTKRFYRTNMPTQEALDKINELINKKNIIYNYEDKQLKETIKMIMKLTTGYVNFM